MVLRCAGIWRRKKNRPADSDSITESLANHMFLTDSEEQATGLSIELRTISNVWAVGEKRLID